MAFEGLSEKLNNVFKKLKSRGKLSESDVKDAMREVRLALLEADVSYKVVKDFVKGVTNYFNSKGIPLRFTFTNPMLEKKHLSDKFCNAIMHYADNGMNEVIVASPLLEEYIRKNYPN